MSSEDVNNAIRFTKFIPKVRYKSSLMEPLQCIKNSKHSWGTHLLRREDDRCNVSYRMASMKQGEAAGKTIDKMGRVILEVV